MILAFMVQTWNNKRNSIYNFLFQFMHFYLTFPSIICTHHILNFIYSRYEIWIKILCSNLTPMCSLFPMTGANKWCLPILLNVFLQFVSIIKLFIKSLCIQGLHLPFMWSFPLSLRSPYVQKINMRWHASSLAIFAQQKSKIGTICLTFLNGKQQKDNHTHTCFALFIHWKSKIGTILPTFPNGKEPKKKEKQSHSHTQNFKSLLLFFWIIINKNTHTIKNCSFHFSKSQKQKEHMCTHSKPCITPNFISQQMSEVVELHKDTHVNLKTIWNKFQALHNIQLQIATNFKVVLNHKTNCKPIAMKKI